MRYPLWVLALPLALPLIHLNYWMWDVPHIVWGLPANLLYHIVFSVAMSALMFAVVQRAWPRYLDED